jgi:hypothetical protein
LKAKTKKKRDMKKQLMEGEIICKNSAWVKEAVEAIKTNDYKNAFDLIKLNWVKLIQKPRQRDDVLTSFLILVECYTNDETLPNRYGGEVYNILLKAFKLSNCHFRFRGLNWSTLTRFKFNLKGRLTHFPKPRLCFSK